MLVFNRKELLNRNRVDSESMMERGKIFLSFMDADVKSLKKYLIVLFFNGVYKLYFNLLDILDMDY